MCLCRLCYVMGAAVVEVLAYFAPSLHFTPFATPRTVL
jgi:hypothetical protein